MAYISEIIDDSSFTGLEEFDAWGALGDYNSAINALFAKLKQSGITGLQMNWLLQQYQPIAQQAPDVVKYPFLYELNERAELKTSDRVPNWLIDQIKDRVVGAVAQTPAGAAAENITAIMEKELAKGTFKAAAKSSSSSGAMYAPGATDLRLPASERRGAGGKGGTDWVTYALIGGAVLAAGVVVWLVFSKDEAGPALPAPAMQGLGCSRGRGRRRR